MTIARSKSSRLSELIGQNSSIFIKEYGRGAMATASFRGTAPSHTHVEWNGLELNSPMLGMVDFSLIPIYIVDQVSILAGSSSLETSSGALGGTILLQNQPDWNGKEKVRLMTGYGSYNSFDEYIHIKVGKPSFQSTSSLYYSASANDFNYLNKLNADLDPATGNYLYKREKNRDADYKNYGLLQAFYRQRRASDSFSWKNWLQHSDRSIPQLQTNESFQSANHNRQNENSVRSVFEWRHYLPTGKLTLMSAGAFQNPIYTLTNPVNGLSDQEIIHSDAKIYSVVNKVTLNTRMGTFLHSTLGFESVWDKVIAANRNANQESTGYNKGRFKHSLHTDLDFGFDQHWRLLFTLREEMIDNRHQAILPMIRFSYQPWRDLPWVFSTSVFRNCHLPTLNDLYFYPGGNPNLKAEYSKGVEATGNASWNLGKSTLKANSAFFLSDIQNWIIWLPTFQGYWEPSNITRVVSKGVESHASFETQLHAFSLMLTGNYAFTITENRSSGAEIADKQLPYIPRHSSSFHARLSKKNCSVEWIWSYYSKRFTTTNNGNSTIHDYLYPYVMNNLELSQTFFYRKHRSEIICKVNNLFNEDYRTVLQRPMPGRNFQILLQYAF
ncbi:MAG: TonB-dependent receptor plug domain-containing protein [Marinilabiliales bacterium]|nr:TonB-dependent receptor plug domain-containing protein [Marinilabiliales bacterium]